MAAPGGCCRGVSRSARSPLRCRTLSAVGAARTRRLLCMRCAGCAVRRAPFRYLRPCPWCCGGPHHLRPRPRCLFGCLWRSL